MPGEALALRRCDVDVTKAPSVRIAGTIVTHSGEPVPRQDNPNTAKSRQTVANPSFAAEAIRKRLVRTTDHSPDTLLFCRGDRAPLMANDVWRQLRHVL